MSGVLWSVGLPELWSGITGASAFDFDGDGAAEIVHADECWARVFDGATGDVVLSVPRESRTRIEYPVVADVDGDYQTELVVTHSVYPDRVCPTRDSLMRDGLPREPGGYQGVTVYRDRLDRWSTSRALWSQHTEHFTQRNDDGTVPVVEDESWEGHNSYRQAHPPAGTTPLDIADLTVGRLEAPECERDRERQALRARVCNRGTLTVASGVEVVFRIPLSDDEACSGTTRERLAPGNCEAIECVWEGIEPDEVHVIRAEVDSGDDDVIPECREDNNTSTLEVRCPPIDE